jgi:hypothetical protein
MNPHDFLELADEEAAGIREVDWRSATAGAYFAAFHVARRLLQQCGFAVPQADQAHGYLWLRLSNSGHPDIQDAGRNLRSLRGYRNQAHYDIEDLFTRAQAMETVLLAGEIIKLLEAATAMPSLLAGITDAIRIYERDVLRQITWLP